MAGGKCQDYVRGVICWSPATGAHSVIGEIFKRYKAVGGAAGGLGFPTTDEKTTPDGVGRYNHFSGSGGSSIYWTPTSGAHSVQGAIRTKWASLGWEAGPLGYPTTDEKTTPDGVGRYNHFSGAVGHSITGRQRRGRIRSPVLSGPSGGPGLGGRAAGLSDHRREGGAVWSGSVQPLLGCGWALDLLVAEDGGALDRRCYSGQVGGPGLGARTAGLSDHRRDGLAGRCGSVQPLLGYGWALDLLVAEDGGALGHRRDPGQMGVARLGERPAGLPDQRRDSVSVGRASDFQRGRLTWNSTTRQVTG